jgi:hypothetical protein
MPMEAIDILNHMGFRPDRKPLAFVHRTKTATIPRTIAGNTDQQAPGLAGGPDRALFKAVILFFFFFFGTRGHGHQYPERGVRWLIILIRYLYPAPFLAPSWIKIKTPEWLVQRKSKCGCPDG